MSATIIDMVEWRQRRTARAEEAAIRSYYGGSPRPVSRRLTLGEILGDRGLGN